ncbi:MAG TPA: hypothetical protein VHY22_02990, partial [Chthoniobacteraceae bacterium]|nr:hypothetical protein [Chthoniobacteraceae bacterium]
MRPPQPLSQAARRNGVALVIVLAFIVILTGVILAFFSRSIANRQISSSSANQAEADLLAQGSVNTIIGDLQQEIVAGSTGTNVVTGTTSLMLYIPTSPQMAVPQLSGTGANTGVNLVKRSAYGVASYTGGPSRAADVSTSGTSLNGRYVTLGRWNEPLMVSSTASDCTPTEPGSLLYPDWILVTRNGANPNVTTVSPGMTYSATGTGSVIGRYAYNIYNEGGLLDMNVAGYPAKSTGQIVSGSVPSAYSYKDAVAMADLTQLPIANGQYLSQTQVNQIVGWRYYGTLSSSNVLQSSFPNFTISTDPSAFYRSFISQNTTNFMGISGTALGSSNQTDHLFGSRQELIRMVLSGLGGAGNSSLLEPVLQYMGTFSRSLNQPTYYPDPTRPKIVGPAATNTSTGSYTGGNSAYQKDNQYNPAFQSIRVSTPFTRADGTPAIVGEPLVKKRFALSRLCWLTYKGPSANLNTSDALYTAYVNLGVSPQLLAEGTPQNIEAYFGLSWVSSPKGPNFPGGYWYYDY